MFCEKCGKEIANNSQFCKYCGSKLSSEGTPAFNAAYVSPAPQPVYAPAQPPKKGGKTWPLSVIIAAIANLALSAISGVLVFYDNYASVALPDYSFGQYFGDLFLSYIVSYILPPALFVLVFALPTKKIPVITSIPLVLEAVFSIISNVYVWFRIHSAGVFLNVIINVLILVFAVLYLLTTVLKKPAIGLNIGLIAVGAIRTIVSFISGFVGTANTTVLTKIILFLSAIALILIFVFAAFKLYGDRKENAVQQTYQPYQF